MEIDLDKGKKKRKRYMKLNLLETSVVGIPAYPDAHFSLLKALHSTLERGNKKQTMSETQTETVAKEVAVVEVKSEEVKVEKEAVAEVVKAEVAVEAVEKAVETEKAIDLAQITDLLNKAIESAVEKLSVKRGLIESDKDVQEKAKAEVKSMSIGQLALKSGFLK
jgi:hypothetical protein